MPRVLALLLFVCLGYVFPAGAAAQTPSTGGARFSDPAPIVAAGAKATLLPDGSAAAPADAPPEVQSAIFAANKLLDKPYKYGGGHAKVEDSGYDCSGTVSYALRGAGLLTGNPLDSGSFMSWGKRGKGKWFTIYTNPGHAFVIIAGLRLDTGMRDNTVPGQIPGRGPRWAKAKRSTRGFTARHPDGF
jgi:hypothetical protein